VSKFYGFLLGERPDPASRQLNTTRMGELFGYAAGMNNNVPAHYIPQQRGTGGTAGLPPQSMLGFVLFDAETFRSLNFTNNDPQFDTDAGTYGGKELDEETWLDKNASPVLINRYNGSLVRGE
jgi:hypothetical protein